MSGTSSGGSLLSQDLAATDSNNGYGEAVPSNSENDKQAI